MERLQPSEERDVITTLVEAYDYGTLPSVDGIEVHESIEGAGDKFRGGEYVFGYVMHEPWASTEEGLPKEFWRNPKRFLAQHDFFLVEGEPKEGDIVGYALDNLGVLYPTSTEVANMMAEKRSSPYFEHFGILTDDGRVVSKFTVGPVYKHDMDKIPVHWGSDVYFFRKRSKSEYVRERDWYFGLTEITYDPMNGTVTVDGEVRKLKGNRDNLMDILSTNQNRPVPLNELAEQIGKTEQAILQLVSRLRKEIAVDPKHTTNIITIPGKGYLARGIIVEQNPQ